MKRLFFASIFAVLLTGIIAYGPTWITRPPDGPIIESSIGQIVARGTVTTYDGSGLYSWDEEQVTFEEDNGESLDFIIHKRTGGIYKGMHCRIRYQEKWVLDFLSNRYRRQWRIISVEKNYIVS